MKKSTYLSTRNTIKRIGIFCLIVLFPICVVCVLLNYWNVSQALNITILVILLFLLFALYWYICGLLDKRKQKKMEESGKKDPFSSK